MRGPVYESSEEGQEALVTEYGINEALVAELFDAVEEAADVLVEEYDLEDEVDVDVVQKYLKIAFAEDISLFIAEGLWSGDSRRRLAAAVRSSD